MEKHEKICPLMKTECKRQVCEWYVDHQELCAVMLLAEDIREIAEVLEDAQNQDT